MREAKTLSAVGCATGSSRGHSSKQSPKTATDSNPTTRATSYSSSSFCEVLVPT